MALTLFKNVSVFDGSGVLPYPGEVLVQGNRIKAVAKGFDQIKAEGAAVVDAGGATLMPGLVEPHSHLSYINCASVLEIGDLLMLMKGGAYHKAPEAARLRRAGASAA